MSVSITSKKPEEAAKLVNAIVEAYIKEVVNKEVRQRLEMSTRLTQIFNNKTNDVRTKRSHLHSLADTLNASSSKAAEVQSTLHIQELHTGHRLGIRQAHGRVVERCAKDNESVLHRAVPGVSRS